MTTVNSRLLLVTRLVAVAMLLAVVVVSAPGPASGSTPFTPIADAYVDANNPGTNYGSKAYLRVDGSPVQYSYLKFDVQGVGPVTSARLDIYAETNGDALAVYSVSDTTWVESTIAFDNAPPLGAQLDSVASVRGGNWYQLDVSGAVVDDGVVTLALATTATRGLKLTAREGVNPPVLLAPAPPPPPSPSPFLVSRSGNVYSAVSQTTTESYTGTLKQVVESAALSLQFHDGGRLDFQADTYDLGTEHLELDDIDGVEFVGQGIGVTTIMNDSNLATDTEVFDAVDSDGLLIQDMTISAGGSLRSTSDALDFDNGNDVVIERVEVVASRGRGIVFDGKGTGWTAEGNVVRDCLIDGVPGDGIELLASSDNLITGCTITNVAGHGIQATKGSVSAGVPNKPSDDNLIEGNVIINAGQDGININSGNRNEIRANVVTNNSDDVTGRDGIRVQSSAGVVCDDNIIEANTATDDQTPKTQKYGLNVSSAACNRTVIRPNTLDGNLVGDLRDVGTNTIYDYPPDTTPPSIPASVTALALSHYQVEVSWAPSTDDVGVAGYIIERDGLVAATVASSVLSFVDETALPGTSYSYTVAAFDDAANTSGPSNPPALVTTPPAPPSITYPAVDDTYVHGVNVGSNYGSSSALRLDGSPDVNAYLKFNVLGVTGTITQATLRLYAQTNSAVGVDVYSVADDSWQEGVITYQSAPAVGPLVASSGPYSTGAYVEIDVTSEVVGNGIVSLSVDSLSSSALKFSSTEGSFAPELLIQQS